MEGATSIRADLDERIDKEMENNLEMRRRCYVFEQKLNVKKQQVVELEADLSAVTEELARKDGECRSLLCQLDHLKRLFHDGERQIEELDCLRDINKGLNEELASSIKENKRLREELRRMKRYSSYRAYESPVSKKEKEKKDDDERWDAGQSRAVSPEGKNDVFAKAIEYLNKVEGEKETTPKASHDNEKAIMEARGRFESLRAKFINGQGRVQGVDDEVSFL
jgi:chromosome segregation ATPase